MNSGFLITSLIKSKNNLCIYINCTCIYSYCPPRTNLKCLLYRSTNKNACQRSKKVERCSNVLVLVVPRVREPGSMSHPSVTSHDLHPGSPPTKILQQKWSCFIESFFVSSLDCTFHFKTHTTQPSPIGMTS